MAPPYNPEETRKKLLDAAFEEIWQEGFRAAGMDAILARAGVTKGALYHHFKNKTELGYAVVEEVVGGHIREDWIEPLAESTDPVTDLRNALIAVGQRYGSGEVSKGCPLNNLAQEMSPIDEGFKNRVQAVYNEWQAALAAALEKGRNEGTVADYVHPANAALFIVTVIQGSIGIMKNDSRPETRKALHGSLMDYFEGLRPGKRLAL